MTCGGRRNGRAMTKEAATKPDDATSMHGSDRRVIKPALRQGQRRLSGVYRSFGGGVRVDGGDRCGNGGAPENQPDAE